jgi:glycosyltransferase 2 family protein
MSPRARRIGGLVAGGLVVAFLAVSLIGGWSKVSAYSWDVDPLALAGAFVLLGLFLLTQGAGYVGMLERLSDEGRLPRLRLLSAWARSILARYVPGNVLMVAGRVVLGREAGVPGRVSLAASVYEQALVVGLSACAAAGLLLFSGSFAQGAWIWIVAVVPLGLLLLHPRLFGPLANGVLRKVKREPLDDLLTTREVVGFVLWYALGLALLGLGVWLVVRGIAGAEAGGPLYVGAGFLLSFVVSMLAFVFPSGIGVREGVLALVLARHLPGEVAIAVAAAVRLALTVAELAFTGLAVLLDRPRRQLAVSPPGAPSPD